MGIISDWGSDPAALFLSEVMRCEDCEYPCVARENSSQANCERHMRELLKDGKVSITVSWRKYIEIKRRLDGGQNG
jgi:hypothetical protein